MIVAFLPKLAEAIRSLLPFFVISFLGGGHGDRTELFASLIGILGGFGAIGAYATTRFEVADGQVVYRTGWIFRRDRRIPLVQIQNVNLRQGLLERLLKVVTLEVETAGGKGAELHLSVLKEADAEQLRQELMVESSHPAEQHHDHDVYRISRHDLILGAVTEHHAIAFLFSALPIIGLNRFVGFAGFWLTLPFLLRWAVGFLAVVLALVAGWLFGACQYIVRYGNFTVRREPGVTRVSYGLLTKVQMVIRPVRIEYALLTSTPWQRLVGRETMSVGTAGSFGEQGTVAKLALMIRREETSEALAKVIPGLSLDRLNWQPFPRGYLLYTLLRGLYSIAVSSIFLIIFFLAGRPPALWVFLIIPALVAGSVADRFLGARRAAYVIDENFVAVRGGYFRQRVELMPTAKVEVAMLRQPPWWRRWRLVSLGVKGMVHGLSIAMVPAAATEVLNELMAKGYRTRAAEKEALSVSPV